MPVGVTSFRLSTAGIAMSPSAFRNMKPECRTTAGFTVVEVLVSLGVIAVLMGILLPALMSARESARLTQCRNNLHQIGVALHTECSARGAFPTAMSEGGTHDRFEEPIGIHERLLFALDAKSALVAKRAYQGARVPVYLCPNDSVADAAAARTLPYCYSPNAGSHFRRYGQNGFLGAVEQDMTPAEISDGLSNTVAFSERLWVEWPDGSENLRNDDLRAYWWTEQRFYGEDEVLLAIDQALNHRISPNPQAFHVGAMDYDHMLPPNSHSSYNGPDAPGVDESFFLRAATSRHNGLVNCLYIDGSVRPISNSVALSIWHALGTRNANDSISDQ